MRQSCLLLNRIARHRESVVNDSLIVSLQMKNRTMSLFMIRFVLTKLEIYDKIIVISFFFTTITEESMKAIVTVVGPDRIGIIADICTLLASRSINIIDISQTVMESFFTMTMLVDLGEQSDEFDELVTVISNKGAEMGLSIRIQREDIFQAMHHI